MSESIKEALKQIFEADAGKTQVVGTTGKGKFTQDPDGRLSDSSGEKQGQEAFIKIRAGKAVTNKMDSDNTFPTKAPSGSPRRGSVRRGFINKQVDKAVTDKINSDNSDNTFSTKAPSGPPTRRRKPEPSTGEAEGRQNLARMQQKYKSDKAEINKFTPIKPVGTKTSNLRMGSRGDDVKALQRSLGLKDDGIFGPKTAAALKAFQQKQGLKVDSIAGDQTMSAIRRMEAQRKLKSANPMVASTLGENMLRAFDKVITSKHPNIFQEAKKKKLHPNQKQLDKNNNGELDSEDFRMLRYEEEFEQIDEAEMMNIDVGEKVRLTNPKAPARHTVLKIKGQNVHIKKDSGEVIVMPLNRIKKVKYKAMKQNVNEGRMPSSVIKHKQRLADMSDSELATHLADKTEKELRDMAARHGYGWNAKTKTGSDHYVKRVAAGKKTFNEAKKLSPKQKEIAKIAGDPDKIDAEDFKKLRKEEKSPEEYDVTGSGVMTYTDPKTGEKKDKIPDIHMKGYKTLPTKNIPVPTKRPKNMDESIFSEEEIAYFEGIGKIAGKPNDKSVPAGKDTSNATGSRSGTLSDEYVEEGRRGRPPKGESLGANELHMNAKRAADNMNNVTHTFANGQKVKMTKAMGAGFLARHLAAKTADDKDAILNHAHSSLSAFKDVVEGKPIPEKKKKGISLAGNM